jgi:hypothetical protein
VNDLGKWLRAEWDRAAGVALVVLGIILVVVGYNGVASSPYVAEELAYLASGAVGGLFLLGCGATLWLSADLHDEWRKLDRIEAAIRGRAGERDAEPDDEPASGALAETNVTSQMARVRVHRTRMHTGVARAAGASEGHANLALVAGLAVAAAVVLVGWNRAAGSDDPKVAFSGLSISLVGVVVASALVAVYTFWLRRSVANRQVELLSPFLIADAAGHAPAVIREPVQRGDGPLDDRVLVASGLTHFHRPGCPATEGLKTKLTPRTRVRAGLSPCGICGAR